MKPHPSAVIAAVRLPPAQRERFVAALLPHVDRPETASDGKGLTLLHHAVIAPLPALLALPIPVDARDSQGGTPLIFAAYYGRATDCSALLARGADPRARTATGRTPLHRVCACAEDPGLRTRRAPLDPPEVVIPLLIAAGGDVNAVDDLGSTPLATALARGDARRAAVLRAHGGA